MPRFLAFAVIGFAVALPASARELARLYKQELLRVGTKKISAWIADDETRREQGLMFIEKMPEDTGMLFVFENPQPLGFWMKNTVIPLAIGFFDENRVLIDIQEMKVAATVMDMRPPTYQSRGPALFALEMNAGWFTRNKIKVGARLSAVETVKSPLLAKKLKSK